ncbi:MAG: DUF721 domain-containing protein [Phenylobacterium sp.]|uniref:DUF721 domain-containing protein n=1 Tax=Phenylobacterium sp. TaxID=1871053 RepID=UPI001A5C7579|nr:DciA family protein [Phenylobacterium sp.]MBL8773869.1 DUF721 domain-containing protein [Phenylobacterium sp.]
MRRRLPTLEEARAILAAKRTRPQRRPPPPAGRALNRYVKELDGRFGQGASALAARWREIVGPEIARRTEPVKLVRGRAGGPSSLEIRVAGPAAAIIQHQAHEVLARVNVFLGPEAVQKLRIVQGPLQRREPPPPARRAAPLDAALEADLARSLAGTPDGKLKDALLKLGRGVLRRGR